MPVVAKVVLEGEEMAVAVTAADEDEGSDGGEQDEDGAKTV